jgi:hypothetical protein
MSYATYLSWQLLLFFFYYYFLGLFPMQCKYAMQCTQDYITLHTSWKQERKEGEATHSVAIVKEGWKEEQ